MAENGIKFNRAYAMPSCTPARNKLLTGRSNVRNYQYFTCMNPGETTIAQTLQNAGYVTGAVGKWQLHGSPLYPEYHLRGAKPSQSGFDEWCMWQVAEYGPRYWDPLIEFHNAPAATRTGEYGPDIFSDYAIDFVDRHAGEPFFLYYSMALGHSPFVPPPGYPSGGNNRKNFGYMIEYMDMLVGRLLNHLHQTGLAEETLVLFVSDNGTSPLIKSDWRGHYTRGWKGITNELGLRTPMIAYWDGWIAPGRESNELVDLVDFFPTIVKLSGDEMPNDAIYDGVSFLPQLLGRKGKAREWIFGYFNPKPGKGGGDSNYRWATNKYFRLYDDGRMYHIYQDPTQNESLQNNPDPIIQANREQLMKILAGHPSEPPSVGY